MIGKQIKGRGFRGLLNYLQEKEGASLIGGNMVGENPRELAAEFRFSRQLNLKVERAVYHVSLSLPKHERLDKDQWNAFAFDYLKGMGFDYNQYCIFHHNDREHSHVHVVASRIRLDGTTVNDSWDYVRSEKLLRQLESLYGLESPLTREMGKRSPTTGQKRRLFREQEEYERGERNTPPEPTVQEKLQAAIDAATIDQPTMPQLLLRLKDQSIDAKVSFSSTGRVQGITYSLEGIRFSGTQLGRDYTFPGLQKHKGINYSLERDNEAIIAASLIEVSPPKKTTREIEMADKASSSGFACSGARVEQANQLPSAKMQRQWAKEILPTVKRAFNLALAHRKESVTHGEGFTKVKGHSYELVVSTVDGVEVLSVTATDGRGELISVSGEELVLVQGLTLKDKDVWRKVQLSLDAIDEPERQRSQSKSKTLEKEGFSL